MDVGWDEDVELDDPYGDVEGFRADWETTFGELLTEEEAAELAELQRADDLGWACGEGSCGV